VGCVALKREATSMTWKRGGLVWEEGYLDYLMLPRSGWKEGRLKKVGKGIRESKETTLEVRQGI